MRECSSGSDSSDWSVFYLMSSSLNASSLSCSARSNDSQAYMWWKNNVKNQIKEALTRYIVSKARNITIKRTLALAKIILIKIKSL